MTSRIVRAALAAGGFAFLLAAAPAPAAGGGVVLFDEGHGQRFLAGQTGDLQLSGLAGLIRAERLEVRTTSRRLDPVVLAGVHAVVISGPFAPLETAEVEALRGFVSGGGRLAVMLHIGQPLLPLLSSMGIQYSRGPIHESDGVIGGKGTDFSVSRFKRHPLTDGLARMSVFGCWALQATNANVTALAWTGPRAWLDTDGDGRHSPADRDGPATVLLAGVEGRGEYAVFGDDALFQNRFLQGYNLELGRRLARWLAAGPPPAPRRGVTDL
jgi:hypothetical protein